jgi:hypothetical protein
MKKGKANDPISSIGGWLLIVLLGLILSAISIFILLIQKLVVIFSSHARTGVYISAILLIGYCAFISITIFMILKRRKIAIKTFIVSAIIGAIFLIWYYIVSQLIYDPDYMKQLTNNILFVIVNIAITIVIGCYLIKSKRVKNTLTR